MLPQPRSRHNPPVADFDAAVGDGGDGGVVGDDGDGAALPVELAEQFEDRFAGGGVEVAGGFVGEEDGRVVDQRAGDGGALDASQPTVRSSTGMPRCSRSNATLTPGPGWGVGMQPSSE
jgi:hypothetical protein